MNQYNDEWPPPSGQPLYQPSARPPQGTGYPTGRYPAAVPDDLDASADYAYGQDPDPAPDLARRRRTGRKLIIMLGVVLVALISLVVLLSLVDSSRPAAVTVPVQPVPTVAIPPVPPAKLAPAKVVPETIYVRGEAMSMWPPGNYVIDQTSDKTCRWMVGAKGKVSARTGVQVRADEPLIENDCTVRTVS